MGIKKKWFFPLFTPKQCLARLFQDKVVKIKLFSKNWNWKSLLKQEIENFSDIQSLFFITFSLKVGRDSRLMLIIIQQGVLFKKTFYLDNAMTILKHWISLEPTFVYFHFMDVNL